MLSQTEALLKRQARVKKTKKMMKVKKRLYIFVKVCVDDIFLKMLCTNLNFVRSVFR
jgi:hypothetical protein